MGETLAFQHTSIGKSSTQPEILPVRSLPQLGLQKRGEFDLRKASGKRFRNLGHQCRRDRTEQQEPAHSLPVSIDSPAKPWEELGPGLGLVEYYEFIALIEFVPVEVKSEALGLLFEIEVDATNHLGKGRLSTLAWADERDSRISVESMPDE
jgi:hypothetical protein